MPVRRPSASVTQPGSSYSAVPNRVHKSTESHHAFAISNASASVNPASIPARSPVHPQQPVVQALVKRFGDKLPIHSGMALDRLENDALIQQTIETLVDLSKDSLDIIAWALAELADRLAKSDAPTGAPTVQLLQSQLFVLKVLALTMSAGSAPDPRAGSRATDHTQHTPDSPRTVHSRPPPSIRSTWLEPSPMDDACARYILSVMVLFLRQTAGKQVPLMLETNSTDISFRDFDLQETMNLTSPEEPLEPGSNADHHPHTLRSRPSAMSMRSGGHSYSSSYHIGSAMRSYERTHLSLIQNPAAIGHAIAKYTGRIIYQLSLKNWNTVQHRLRSKIRFMGTNGDDSLDFVDIQLMAHCMLDRQRLVLILGDLSSLLVNMTREAQIAISISLRTAVWNWIEGFPHEFNEAIRNRGKTEGAPERVFDLLYSVPPLNNERIFWPCLAVLSSITYDRISSDFQTSSYSASKRKDQRFGTDLLRNIHLPHKLSEIALACAVDFCRAAAFVDGNDEVSLRLVASDLAHEIKGALWNSSARRAFWEIHDEIDVALYADALVSVFRFLPEEDSIPLFVVCIEPERSEAVKLCVVRACLTLNQDASRFYNQKPLDRLQNAIGHRLRNVLMSLSTGKPELDQYKNIKRVASRPKCRRSPAEPLNDKEIIILALLSLTRQFPNFFMKGANDDELENWMVTTLRLWDAPMDIAVKASTACCLHRTTEMTFLTAPNPRDVASEFTIQSLRRSLPMTLQSVSAHLLSARTDPEAQGLYIALVHSIVDIYSKKIDLDHVRSIQLDGRRVAALIVAEIALLVSLTSVQLDVSHLAAKSLRLLSQAEMAPDAPVSPMLGPDERRKRSFVYEQLGDPTIVVVGRVGHHKRIRKLMKLISYNSPVHTAVWAECYSRWKTISQPLYEALGDDFGNGSGGSRNAFGEQHQESLKGQWQFLTLFLATLCGACASDKPELKSLVNYIPIECIPDKARASQQIPALAETFIVDLLNLLVHHDLQIRATAREALGDELSARFYLRLTRNMEEHMRGIEQGAGSRLKDEYILFLDQFLSVLRALAESTTGSSDDVPSIDVSGLMHSIAEFIARFEDKALWRIQTKYSALVLTICERSEVLAIRKDSDVRNNILDIILDWIVPSYPLQNGHSGGGSGGMAGIGGLQPQTPEDAAMVAELNISCLRTAVKLLEKLQLRTSDVSVSNPAGEETMHVVSGLFKRYADRLLQCLDNSRFDGPPNQKDDTKSETGSIQVKMKMSSKEAELRDLVITGLTHLVTSNSESGFKQCLHLAYDPDNRKRTIFAHVFARVIGEGTTFEPLEPVAQPNRHARFAELLRGSDMVLAMTICEICPPGEVEMIITVLLNVFDTPASLMALMKLMIEREVAQTDSESALFRSNSTYNRLLSAFTRNHGYLYLRSILNPLVRAVAGRPEGEDSHASMEFAATQFFSIITVSKDLVPPMLREISAHIVKTVGEVWPNAKLSALGAFIFLRCISPAIVSPELIDVELPKDKEEGVFRKALLGVARSVQSLANFLFMKDGNTGSLPDFIVENRPKIIQYLESIQDVRQATQVADPDPWAGVMSDETDVIVLHRFFDKHADKIGKELLSLSKPSSEGDVSAVNGKRAWDGLCALLVDLGTPLEVPRPSSANSYEHQEYLDLMADSHGRSTTRVRDLFVETDVVDEVAYFVFRLTKVDVEDLDIQMLMYHIFKTLTSETYIHRNYDIIIDCTSFSSISEIPLHWLKYCAEVVPADIRERFRTAHILNPNFLTHKYLRRLYNVSAATPFCQEVRAYPSVELLLDSGVPPDVIHALAYPVSVEQEPVEGRYNHVMMRQAHTRVTVELQVSSRHIRVTTAKAPMISPGLSSRYVEIIPLGDVLDIYNIQAPVQTPEQTDFLIRRRQTHMFFTSPERDAIVKAIRTAKGKLKDAPSPLSERFSRFSNVPATLLHIGFLSVDPNDEELRGAAYNLLGAVCTYLKYDKAPIVAQTAGFIPGDPFTFFAQLSDKLADFAPQLTLDFIHEASAAMSGMDKSATAQRISCLHYMSPWIRNLSNFANPTSNLFEKSGSRLRDCVRTLSDLALNYPEIMSTLQKAVWSEMAKLDTFVTDIILDELVRTAVDGGIGTRRCEVVAQIVAAMSSISIRSRLYSRLRKAIGRPPQKTNTKNTLENHFNWTEIAVLVRLIAALGSNQTKAPSPNQLFIPDLCHLITIVAADGPSLVRKSAYGTVLNLLQTLYVSRSEELSGPDLLQLIDRCTSPSVLALFGLKRETPTSEYTNLDDDKKKQEDNNSLNKGQGDKKRLDQVEGLVKFLIRVTEVASGSRGLLNIWRARWMSLVTATAFQLSPVVQTRSFVALGALATAEVDDDYVYQIMVALRTCLTRATESNTITVVSMLRCLCKIVPALSPTSRYPPMFFWLAVALLQSAVRSFYHEAANLLTFSLESMEELGYFREHDVPTVLLEARTQVEEFTSQFDDMLGISFDTHFSISLAHIMFKGMREAPTLEAAETALRCLLTVTARTHNRNHNRAFEGYTGVLCPEILGYFLALLPVSTTPASYQRLLRECMVDDAWHHDAGLPDEDSSETQKPRVNPTFLGVNDSNLALLVATFAATTVCTAQGDDAETEILYGLLSDLATSFPDTINLIYDSLRDKIQDSFMSSSNPHAIRSATNIFRVWSSLQMEGMRYESPTPRGSTTTLDRTEDKFQSSTDLLHALDSLKMRGLAFNLVFLASTAQATKVMHWITNLVALIS